MNKKTYTIKELSELHSVSTRTIEKRLSSLVYKDKNRILIPLDVVILLEKRHNTEPKSELNTEPNTELNTEPNTELNIEVEHDIVEGFSQEEYQEFQKRLIEYPLLKEHLATILNQLEYFKESSASKDRQMELILQNIRERNFIEAKDKDLGS